MPQDWFSANAPKAPSAPAGDWFASNAPKTPPMAVSHREPGLATIGEQLESKGMHPRHAANARLGRPVIDAAKGAGAGLLSTMYHGGDLIRRGLGMERVIDRPEVQAAITPPDSVGGKIGFYGEQAAEFAIPLTRLSKATKGAGLMRRAATDAAASGGVAAVQSGADPGQMGVALAGGAVLPFAGKALGATGRAIKNAAAGAQEGGLAGALAGAVRTVAPASSKGMLIQGLKPRATQRGFEKSLDLAIPELKATEQALGRPIQSIDDLIEATTLAKKRVRAEYDAMAGDLRDVGRLVNGNAVADLMEKSIPSKLKLENPEAAARLIQRARSYRRNFPLEEAEQLLKETNAELDSFYGKYPMAQRKALLSDPDAALLNAQGKAWRDAIYKTIDSKGQGEAARAVNRRYGALMDLEDAAVRRANVAKRQQPESLSEQIGNVRAAGDMARGAWRLAHGDLSGAADIAAARAGREMAKYLKEQQTTDALIRRAFADGRLAPARGTR